MLESGAKYREIIAELGCSSSRAAKLAREHGLRRRGPYRQKASRRLERAARDLQIVELRERGMKVDAIAERMSCSRTTVMVALRSRPHLRARRIQESELLEAVELRKKGWSWRAIAGEIGWNHNYVAKLVRERYGDPRPRHMVAAWRRDSAPRLRAQGMTYAEIAFRLRCSRTHAMRLSKGEFPTTKKSAIL